MPVSPARASAFEILLRVEKTDAYSSELLHSARHAKLSRQDHNLTTELVMGVLRWRGVIDREIARHSAQSISRLDLEVLVALRLGAYQLLFLDRIPKHTGVNESVELVKHARKRSAAGMVNAILRKVAKTNSEILHGSRNAAEIDPRRVPPDLAVAAHPKWLVEKWSRSYGVEVTRQICVYDQNAPRTTIRINDSSLFEELSREGITLRPGELVAKAFVVEAGDVTRTKAFRERRLTIQDEASQLVALLAGKGESLLDCCAAPGGKTRILSDQNPESRVVAMEIHPYRAALLKRLLPIEHLRVVSADARQLPLAAKFDRVLVDAPCSGTGTLARNPEIKWRLNPEKVSKLQRYQIEILASAMKQVAPGGRLIYSTCSLEPEENSDVVETVIVQNPSFRLIDCRDELERLKRDGELVAEDIPSLMSDPYLRTIPGVHSCDGFFAAILERS